MFTETQFFFHSMEENHNYGKSLINISPVINIVAQYANLISWNKAAITITVTRLKKIFNHSP